MASEDERFPWQAQPESPDDAARSAAAQEPAPGAPLAYPGGYVPRFVPVPQADAGVPFAQAPAGPDLSVFAANPPGLEGDDIVGQAMLTQQQAPAAVTQAYEPAPAAFEPTPAYEPAPAAFEPTAAPDPAPADISTGVTPSKPAMPHPTSAPAEEAGFVPRFEPVAGVVPAAEPTLRFTEPTPRVPSPLEALEVPQHDEPVYQPPVAAYGFSDAPTASRPVPTARPAFGEEGGEQASAQVWASAPAWEAAPTVTQAAQETPFQQGFEATAPVGPAVQETPAAEAFAEMQALAGLHAEADAYPAPDAPDAAPGPLLRTSLAEAAAAAARAGGEPAQPGEAPGHADSWQGYAPNASPFAAVTPQPQPSPAEPPPFAATGPFGGGVLSEDQSHGAFEAQASPQFDAAPEPQPAPAPQFDAAPEPQPSPAPELPPARVPMRTAFRPPMTSALAASEAAAPATVSPFAPVSAPEPAVQALAGEPTPVSEPVPAFEVPTLAEPAAEPRLAEASWPATQVPQFGPPLGSADTASNVFGAVAADAATTAGTGQTDVQGTASGAWPTTDAAAMPTTAQTAVLPMSFEAVTGSQPVIGSELAVEPKETEVKAKSKRSRMVLWIALAVIAGGALGAGVYRLFFYPDPIILPAPTVTAEPVAPTVDAVTYEDPTEFLSSIPTEVGANVLLSYESIDPLGDSTLPARAAEHYVLEFGPNDASQVFEVTAFQHYTEDEAITAYESYAGEGADAKDVEVDGVLVGERVTITSGDTATIVWRNGTAVFLLEGPADQVDYFYERFGL